MIIGPSTVRTLRPVGLGLLVCAFIFACQPAELQIKHPPSSSDEPDNTPKFSTAGLGRDEVIAFLGRLKRAVADDDRNAVANLVSYPLTVRGADRSTTLRNAKDFVSHYPMAMNERVRAAVLACEPQDLWANAQGVRIGRGEIWFAGVYTEESSDDEYSVLIITVNSAALVDQTGIRPGISTEKGD